MTTTNPTPVDAGATSQPASAPGAPHCRPRTEGVGQSGPARYEVRPIAGRGDWFSVNEIGSHWAFGAVRGRTEAAKLCRRLNGGAR